MGLEPRAFLVRQARHRLAEVQENLTGHFPDADSLPAGGRAGGPVARDEAVKREAVVCVAMLTRFLVIELDLVRRGT